MMYDDLNDHPFAIFQASESYTSPREQRWLAWIRQAETLVGHSLDGDEDEDGYSMDGAYAAWEHGETPAAYAAEVSPRNNPRRSSKLPRCPLCAAGERHLSCG
jgi:hypothetical protein